MHIGISTYKRFVVDFLFILEAKRVSTFLYTKSIYFNLLLSEKARAKEKTYI